MPSPFYFFYIKDTIVIITETQEAQSHTCTHTLQQNSVKNKIKVDGSTGHGDCAQ